MGFFRRRKLKRILRNAKKANTEAELANQSAKGAAARIDKLVAQFKEIECELDLIPWYNPFKWNSQDLT